MINRLPLYIALFLCSFAAIMLFSIKDVVLTLRSELREVKKQIEAEGDTIHILKSELAYLSSPSRLRTLSDQYLKLETTKVSQLVEDPSIAKHNENLNSATIAYEAYSRKMKWRYKKGPSQYVTVSAKKT